MPLWCKKHMKKFIFYSLIGLIGLTPLLWFKGDLIIAYGDDALFLNPGAVFNSVKWAWDSFYYNCGGANNSFPLVFPLSFFWHVLTKLGIGLALIERCWLVIVWLITGLSMFYLTRVLGLNIIGSFFACLLYSLNVFTVQQPLVYNFRLPYMIQPLLLAFTIKGLDLGGKISKYIILFSLSTLLAVSAWTNPPWALAMFIPVLFYIPYRLFLYKDKKRTVYFIIGVVFLTFILNLWWLIPYSASIEETISYISGLKIKIFFGKGFYEIFRFLKSWAFNRTGYEFHKLYYNSWIVILATYLIPITVFFSLFRKGRGFKNCWFFVFLAFVGMFLTKGPIPPLGFIYDYLFRNLPGFVIFREPYTKFTPLVILSFSILFGDTSSWIYGIFRKRYRQFVLVTVLVLILIPASPIFTKGIFWQRQNGWSENRGARSAYVKVPAYWHTAERWFKAYFHKGRLFTIPRPTGVYNWDSGFNCGDTVARYFLNIPVISCSGNNNIAIQFLNHIYAAFVNEGISLYNILRMFNVRYILHDKDIYTNTHWQLHDPDYLPPMVMKKRLQIQGGMDLVRSIGQLDIYKVKDEYYLPKLYTANNLTYVEGSLEDLAINPLQELFYEKPAVFLNKEDLPSCLAEKINNIAIVRRNNHDDRFSINIPESGNYDISVNLIPRFINKIEFSGARIDIDLINLFSNARFNPNLISSYDYKLYPNEMVLRMPFDGNSLEDEYLQIKDFNPKGNDIDIDLTKYPYLRFCYRVEDPEVQIIQLLLGIDIDGDDKVNFWLRDIYERPAKTGFCSMYYNVQKKVRLMQQQLGEEETKPYYHAIKLEIYPHKFYKVDCSKNPRNYNFFIKKLQFMSKFNYKRDLVIKDKGLDKFIADNTDSVDLIQYNQIEFQWLGLPMDGIIDVKLKLDLNNDGLEDVEEVVYSFNPSTMQISHLIDFQEVMLMGYEDVLSARLLTIQWNSSNINPEDIKNRLRRIIIYRQQPVEDYRDFHFKDYIFSIGDKKYQTELYSLGSTKSKSVTILYKDIPLTSGRNIVENLLAENDPFSFQWICLKKSKPPQIPQGNFPKIKWQKLNPTKYLLDVIDSSGPFLLVFSESYHNRWKAYTLPNKNEIKAHILVNGYAQGWWIENPSRDFQIIIRYIAQDWTNIGWIISGITLLGCLGYLWFKK